MNTRLQVSAASGMRRFLFALKSFEKELIARPIKNISSVGNSFTTIP